ncbi:hypothetical protein MMC10_005617 [Thelotrema lepadinum]|nr:hypothetical protein [Thelotrema lepadinum]
MHFSSALVAAAISAGSVSGHMIMKTPAPFGSPNSSPLLADGSDFPCKGITSPPPATANTMPIGAPQTLSFTGSAVHGGGSCQVALTTDKAPTKTSKWMVIHSIIGGCPSNTTDGNLAEDPSGSSANKYTYSIPSGISPGEYTLAWTWFNKIGNREMYMNCAPVTVTGGSSGSKRSLSSRGKQSLRDSLGWFNRRASFPDLFKANIGSASAGCATVDSTDVIFPDPGDSVESDRGPSNPSAKPPTGCSASPSVPAAGGGAAPTSAAGASPTAVTAGSAPTTAAPSVAPVPTTSAAVVVSQPAAASPTPASGSGSGSTGSSAGALSGACTNEGAWNCLGGTQTQRCASGMWSPPQPVPAGEKCSGGQSADLELATG